MTKTMKMLMLLLLTMVGTTVWAGDAQTIRLVATDGGTVTVKEGENTLAFGDDGKSTTTVAAGATITLTVAPAEGYYADVLSVNKTVDLSAAPSLAPRRTGGVGTGDIALTRTLGNGNLHESNTYTFKMPSSVYSGVNIVVNFEARTNVNTTGEGAVTIDDIADQTYTGQSITPELTVKHGETTLTAGKDYTVAYANHTNVPAENATDEQKPKATVSFIGKYNAGENTLSKTFVINKAPLTVTAKPKTITYGDAPANDGVEYDGFVGEENSAVLGGTLDYTYSYAQFGNVGSYTITPSGLTSDNYDITFTAGTLTVSKAPLTITADDKSVTYGDAAPEYTVSYSGFVNNETESVLGGFLNIVCTYTQGGSVGTYDITPSGFSAQNYAITYVKGTLTVNAPPTYAITDVAEDANGNKVVASTASATAGTEITLTITTADTYTLKSISATGVVLIGTGTTRTFNMPAAAVTVTATWEEKTQESAKTEVTENVDIVDNSHATVTSVEIGAQTTSITISGTVSDGTNNVPITSIANGVFTAENTANVKNLDLSNTAITLTGDARGSGSPLENVDINTIIYMPATSTATGVNVVKSDNTCAEVRFTEGKALINKKADFTTTKLSFNRTFLTGSGQLNTIFLPVDIPASVAATLGTFYTCSSVDVNGAVLTTVSSSSDPHDLSANTAYIFAPANATLSINGSTNLTVKVNANVTNPTGAGLKGTNVEGTISTLATDATKAYGYAAETTDGATVGAFYKLKSTATVPAYRAWLEVTDALSPRLSVIIEGEGTTSIRTIDGVAVNEGTYYDLNGRKFSGKPTKKVLYIHGGHKVVVR